MGTDNRAPIDADYGAGHGAPQSRNDMQRSIARLAGVTFGLALAAAEKADFITYLTAVRP
jgi:hypothetical protein